MSSWPQCVSFLLRVAVALTFLAAGADAREVQYAASLSGTTEFPSNNSPGSGQVLVTIDLDTALMRGQSSFAGLLGTTTAAHIHCCTASPGAAETSPVATQVPSFADFPTGVTSGTYDHTFDMTQASSWNPAFVTAQGGIANALGALLAGLASGRAYFNIHSTIFPGGEIRGFPAVIPWDVFWRNGDGTNAIWHFTGASPTQLVAAFPPGVETTWQPIGTGDVNGDGVPDVVWLEGATGQVAIWLMASPAIVGFATFPASVGATSGWTPAGIADVDGDGRADLLWRNSVTGQLLVWYFSLTGAVASTHDYGIVPLPHELRGLGDVNADGTADLVWFRPSDGQVTIWKMAPDHSFTAAFPGAVGAGSWRPYRIGDFDGDGKADVFWRNDASGATAAWYLDGGVIADTDFFVSVPIAQWNLGTTGDFDKDGHADLMWHAPASGNVVRWLMHGRHAAPTIQPLPGVASGWQMVP